MLSKISKCKKSLGVKWRTDMHWGKPYVGPKKHSNDLTKQSAVFLRLTELEFARLAITSQRHTRSSTVDAHCYSSNSHASTNVCSAYRINGYIKWIRNRLYSWYTFCSMHNVPYGLCYTSNIIQSIINILYIVYIYIISYYSSNILGYIISSWLIVYVKYNNIYSLTLYRVVYVSCTSDLICGSHISHTISHICYIYNVSYMKYSLIIYVIYFGYYTSYTINCTKHYMYTIYYMWYIVHIMWNIS